MAAECRQQPGPSEYAIVPSDVPRREYLAAAVHDSGETTDMFRVEKRDAMVKNIPEELAA